MRKPHSQIKDFYDIQYCLQVTDSYITKKTQKSQRKMN